MVFPLYAMFCLLLNRVVMEWVRETAVIIGMVVFLLLAASSAAVVYAQRAPGWPWLLPSVFGSLCLVLWMVYRFTLAAAARKMETRREKMLLELG